MVMIGDRLYLLSPSDSSNRRFQLFSPPVLIQDAVTVDIADYQDGFFLTFFLFFFFFFENQCP